MIELQHAADSFLPLETKGSDDKYAVLKIVLTIVGISCFDYSILLCPK